MSSSTDAAATATVAKKRRICERCDRPATTCLCAVMPEAPISLSGHVIVIRHPNEQKKPLATIPVLAKCLKNMTVVHGRQYKKDQDSLVDELLGFALAGQCPLYMLFPGPKSLPLDQLPPFHKLVQQQQQPGELQQQQQQAGPTGKEGGASTAEAASTTAEADGTTDPAAAGASRPQGTAAEVSPEASTCTLVPPAYVLLCVDGTWREAKEMWTKVSAVLLSPAGPGVQVTLPARPEANLQLQGQGQQQQGIQGQQQQQGDLGQQQQHGAESGSGEAAAGPPGCLSGHKHGRDGEVKAEGQQAQQQQQQQQQGDIGQRQQQQQQGGVMAGPCLIRKEPVDGYLTTYEALCRAISILEGDTALEESLLEPLRLMTRYQAKFDPAVAARNQWAARQGAAQP